MRPLKSHFPDHALTTLDTVLKQTKEARVFRRAQAVHAVVAGNRLRRLRHLPLGEFCPAQMGAALCPAGPQGLRGSPPLRSTAQSHVRAGTAPQSPRRSRPPPASAPSFPMELPRTRDRARPADRRPAGARKCPLCLKKNDVSFYRPTGRLIPPRLPSPMARSNWPPSSTRLAGARSFCSMKMKRSSGALPCPGGLVAHSAQRARLPTRPLSQSQIKRDERLKRQAWVRYRSWSRITSGVLLSVIGAVQYGTSKVFYKIVPHFDAQEFRQYIHQVMALFRHNRQRGGDGRRSQWHPSGAQARRRPSPTTRASFASISYPPIVATTSIPSKCARRNL